MNRIAKDRSCKTKIFGCIPQLVDTQGIMGEFGEFQMPLAKKKLYLISPNFSFKKHQKKARFLSFFGPNNAHAPFLNPPTLPSLFNSQLASVGRRSVWMTELCPLSGCPRLEDTLSATYPAGWVFWVGKQERWDLSQNRPRRHTVPTHPPFTKLTLLHQQSSLFLPTMHTHRFSTHPPFHLFLIHNWRQLVAGVCG